MTDVTSPTTTPDSSDRAARVGRLILAAVATTFIAIATPLIWRGAPLADDFNNCVAPTELGLGGFMTASWRQLGAIRPARFLEILVTAGVCRSLPFGVAIAVSMLLTLAVALLVRGLLRDIGIPATLGGRRRRALAAPAARDRGGAVARRASRAARAGAAPSRRLLLYRRGRLVVGRAGEHRRRAVAGAGDPAAAARRLV